VTARSVKPHRRRRCVAHQHVCAMAGALQFASFFKKNKVAVLSFIKKENESYILKIHILAWEQTQ
jgi:hypothetical protein